MLLAIKAPFSKAVAAYFGKSRKRGKKVGQKGQYSGGLLGKKIGILYMGAASNSCVVPEVDPWVGFKVFFMHDH